MNAYIFQAALLCEACARKVMDAKQPYASNDSNTYPQGPYPDGGGEADSPQHCDHCRTFLENPLTSDGVAYVVDAINHSVGNSDVLDEWSCYYGVEAPARP
jgi:hypothetical protein